MEQELMNIQQFNRSNQYNFSYMRIATQSKSKSPQEYNHE